MSENHCHRVVLTGGPGGGKTTAADLFRRELGEKVVVVPEAATILYAGGFPRSEDKNIRRSIQQAIFHVQRNLETIKAEEFKSRILLCDRGTVDGAAYWPGPAEEFFSHMGTTLEAELNRYDSVVFFETAAVGGISIEGGNPVRSETLGEAIALDQKLKSLWSQHPEFHFVPNNHSFLHKIGMGLSILSHVVQTHCETKP